MVRILTKICDVDVQDQDALSVSSHLGVIWSEPFDMHDGDKIGRSEIGKLVRSKDNVSVNPFPEGKSFI